MRGVPPISMGPAALTPPHSFHRRLSFSLSLFLPLFWCGSFPALALTYTYRYRREERFATSSAKMSVVLVARVSHLSPNFTEAHLRELLEPVLRIRSIKLSTPTLWLSCPRGRAEVVGETDEDTMKVFAQLNGSQVDGAAIAVTLVKIDHSLPPVAAPLPPPAPPSPGTAKPPQRVVASMSAPSSSAVPARPMQRGVGMANRGRGPVLPPRHGILGTTPIDTPSSRPERSTRRRSRSRSEEDRSGRLRRHRRHSRSRSRSRSRSYRRRARRDSRDGRGRAASVSSSSSSSSSSSRGNRRRGRDRARRSSREDRDRRRRRSTSSSRSGSRTNELINTTEVRPKSPEWN